jgi:SAM-dependent methyltransferase
LPVPDGEVDVFTSFETIEHLEDDGALVAEAARVLKPDGKFICSTPNRALVHPGASLADRPLNRHHLREYNREEFAALLGDRFPVLEWFGQTPFSEKYGRLLEGVGRRTSTLAGRLHQARKLVRATWRGAAAHHPRALQPGTQPEILIAVCLLS